MPADAQRLLTTLRPDGSWPDIDYSDPSLAEWAPGQHLRRLANLTIINLRTNQAVTSHQLIFREHILRALDFWFSQNPQCRNWWWNQIGAPAALGDTLLCLTDCPQTYIDRAIPALEAHLHGGLDFTGQNLVWVASIQIRQGILTHNASLITRAVKRIVAEIRIFPHEEGIQPDMSFHQHGKLLYNGGYGQNFAQDIAHLIALTADTRFALPDHAVNLFTRFMLHGSRWMVRNNTFDPATSGREITRPNQNADRFFQGLQALPPAPAHQPKTATPIGNRHFWSSDFMAHHRQGFYISIRTTSNRILRCDDAHCGGEGRTLHHIADGVTHFMRDGLEYHDIYPVWNYRQLPGITAFQHTGEFDRKTLVTKGETAFSGGASDGSVGCNAMDFNRDGLLARKAWFLFDDAMVALGAGITSTSRQPVRTTINQCLWRGPVHLDQSTSPLPQGTHLIPPGHSFHHDGLRYLLLDNSQASLTLGSQSGAWSHCGVGSPDPIALPVLNAGIDHGSNPHNATYAYAVIHQPNHSPSSPFTILSNTPKLQAVWHTAEKRAHAVFYQPGSITFPDNQSITVDQPCILLYHPLPNGKLALTLADPAQHAQSIALRLQGPITSQLTLPLPAHEYAGSSQTIQLQ
jgi:chondroitin AC lyase